MTCAVSSALRSHERTGASDNQIYKGTAQLSALRFTTHSPNDTLDALREHADASTCDAAGKVSRWKAKQSRLPGCTLTETSACTALTSCKAWTHTAKSDEMKCSYFKLRSVLQSILSEHLTVLEGFACCKNSKKDKNQERINDIVKEIWTQD